MTQTLDELASLAQHGDRTALEALVRGVQDPIYRLAFRMLGDMEEARDATQEIVLKAVTRLSTFSAKSSFKAWALKVATNHLINLKQGRREMVSFDTFGEVLDQGLAWHAKSSAGPFQAAVVEEAKLLCTQGMLTCLDREHRLAFVLGEVFELSGDQAAQVLDIEPAAFRKRLSRGRDQLEAFAQGRCGLVNPARPCRCEKQAAFGVAHGMLDPARLSLTRHATAPSSARAELERLQTAAALMRSHPDYAAPQALVDALKELVPRIP